MCHVAQQAYPMPKPVSGYTLNRCARACHAAGGMVLGAASLLPQAPASRSTNAFSPPPAPSPRAVAARPQLRRPTGAEAGAILAAA
jgi:hypothetical protein